MALLFSLLAISCSREGGSGQAACPNPLGVFNFDFARLGADEASQISQLKSIGYGGLVMNLTNPEELETLEQHQSSINDDSWVTLDKKMRPLLDGDDKAHLGVTRSSDS